MLSTENSTSQTKAVAMEEGLKYAADSRHVLGISILVYTVSCGAVQASQYTEPPDDICLLTSVYSASDGSRTRVGWVFSVVSSLNRHRWDREEGSDANNKESINKNGSTTARWTGRADSNLSPTLKCWKEPYPSYRVLAMGGLKMIT